MKPTRWIAAVAVAVVVLGATEAARAADTYAAIAYSPCTRSYGTARSTVSQADADNAALNNCSGPDRQVIVTVQNGWAALASSNTCCYGYAWSTGSQAEAQNDALGQVGGPNAGAHLLCVVGSGD